MQFLPSNGRVDITTWMLTIHMEKKLDGNYTRMLRAILNKSWRQHPQSSSCTTTYHPSQKTIKIRQTRHAGYCWRSSDVLLWTISHGRAKAGRAARTYIQQFCADTGCSLEDLPEAMDNRKVWRERVRNIHADSMTWWWYKHFTKLVFHILFFFQINYQWIESSFFTR